MIFYTVRSQKPCQTTSSLIKLLMEVAETLGKASVNVCAWTSKCLRLPPPPEVCVVSCVMVGAVVRDASAAPVSTPGRIRVVKDRLQTRTPSHPESCSLVRPFCSPVAAKLTNLTRMKTLSHFLDDKVFVSVFLKSVAFPSSHHTTITPPPGTEADPGDPRRQCGAGSRWRAPGMSLVTRPAPPTHTAASRVKGL